MKSRRDVLREALDRASGGTRPDVSRLVDAVPDLMAEARRRREADLVDLPTIVATRAWGAVPRLAVATAVAVVIASIALLVETGTTAAGTTTFESVILDGNAGSNGGTGDVLLDAVLASEKSDG